MKSITIIGNLGSQAVRRVTNDGKELMSFSVAVNVKDDYPIWFNCIGNLRENLLDYLIKGQTVCVIGDLRPGLYKGELDLTVSIDRIELCGRKPENANNAQESSLAVAP